MLCKNCHNENIDGVKFCFFCGSELSDLAEKQTINDTANNNSKKNTEDTSTVDANDSKQNHNLNSKNIFQKCSKNKKIIVIAGSVILGITILILIPIIINSYDTSSNNNDFYSGYNGSVVNDNEKYTSSSYLNNDYSEDDVLDSEDNSMDSNEINDNSSMDYDYLYDDDDNNEENDSESDDTTPFYGIWCFASQKQSEAYNFANGLSDNGWNALVVITTDWDNLNNEKWYVVSAGAYETYDAANKDLDDIKSICPSAYVKYSGEHK